MTEKPWMNLYMGCKTTGKDEPQYLVKEDDDGVYLRCGGCGKVHGHEIGYFADLFNVTRKNIKTVVDDMGGYIGGKSK
jgi:uncharacterized Zn finger protein